jgi:uncharacterized protein YciI
MLPNKLFVVILKYIVSIEEIDHHRPAHLEYLQKYYDEGVFLASGRQVPKFGGIILAKTTDRKKLYEILSEDPFHKHLCAEYQVNEFAVNNYTDSFKSFLQESGLI